MLTNIVFFLLYILSLIIFVGNLIIEYKIKYDFEAEYLCLQIMSCYTFNKYCVIFTSSLYVHALNRVARQKLVVMLDKAAPSTDTMKA